MLSKKMTFSLMSLITLLAFAFVVPSAMAANDIGSDLILTADIGHADGLQMQHPGAEDDGTIDASTTAADNDIITIRFAKPVDLTPANLSISIFDEDADFLSTPVAAVDNEFATDVDNEFTVAQSVTDIRDWTITFESIAAEARTLKVRVAEGVASSDAFEDNATVKKDHTITLLAENSRWWSRCLQDCAGR